MLISPVVKTVGWQLSYKTKWAFDSFISTHLELELKLHIAQQMKRINDKLKSDQNVRIIEDAVELNPT